MLGSLAGIGEIAKATFGGGDRRRRRRRQAAAAPRKPTGPTRLHDARLYAAESLSERAMMIDISSRSASGTGSSSAAVFFVLELVAPGAFMLWLGLSALLVGIISLLRRLAVAVPARRLRGVRARLDPAVAALRAPRREGGRSAVPQPPRGCLRRPRVHAGKADRRRHRHGEDRRHDLAAVRARTARRQPRQGRARGRRDAGGGAGAELTPRPRAADRADARCRPACRRRPRSRR